MKDKSGRLSERSEGKGKIESLFKPGIRVDIVLNNKSMIPDVRSAVVYECNHDESRMVISQTRPEIVPSLEFNQMDITVLVEEELNRKIRNGLSCKVVRFLKDYKMLEQIEENAILVEYFPPVVEMNVRSAFRLEPGSRFIVEATIQVGKIQYISGRDFKVKDISFTGIGLVVPKLVRKKHSNDLLEMEKGETAGIVLRLINNTSGGHEIAISSEVEMVRRSGTLNPENSFIGMRFTALSDKDEEFLSGFIHNAQLDKIRKTRRY